MLPFANLSNDSNEDYFADSIGDDLTTDLSHLPDSFVVAHDTAMTYKGKAVDMREIGRELGVRYAVEGSVRPIGDEIGVNVQLISTENGTHIRADRFEAERDKLNELQAAVVPRLANSLRVELVKAESLRAMREHPNNPDAADLSMRAWAVLNEAWDPEHLNKAVNYFDQALRLDPDYPQAITGKAVAQIVNLVSFHPDLEGGLRADHGVLTSADRAADRILSSQPHNAWAHLTKALVAERIAQFDAALAEANAAIVSDPSFTPAYAEKGRITLLLGRPTESLKTIEYALRLNPAAQR